MTAPMAPHPAVVALPPKAVAADDWQPSGGYRIFEGEERDLGHDVKVWTHGIQFDDGGIDDGTGRVGEAPGISVDGVYWEKSLSASMARQLADVLVTAADEIDAWVTR